MISYRSELGIQFFFFFINMNMIILKRNIGYLEPIPKLIEKLHKIFGIQVYCRGQILEAKKSKFFSMPKIYPITMLRHGAIYRRRYHGSHIAKNLSKGQGSSSFFIPITQIHRLFSLLRFYTETKSISLASCFSHKME